MNGRWWTTTSRCSRRVRSWSRQRQGQGARQEIKLQCVTCCGHGHTSAQCTMRSTHSVDESERGEEEGDAGGGYDEEPEGDHTDDAGLLINVVSMELCFRVRSLVSSILRLTVVRLYRSCLSVGRVLCQVIRRRPMVARTRSTWLRSRGFCTADARAFLAKRVVAPGGWVLGFAGLPCIVC